MSAQLSPTLASAPSLTAEPALTLAPGQHKRAEPDAYRDVVPNPAEEREQAPPTKRAATSSLVLGTSPNEIQGGKYVPPQRRATTTAATASWTDGSKVAAAAEVLIQSQTPNPKDVAEPSPRSEPEPDVEQGEITESDGSSEGGSSGSGHDDRTPTTILASSPQSSAGAPKDPMRVRRSALVGQYKQVADTLEGFFGLLCFRNSNMPMRELASKLQHEQELIASLVNIYKHNEGRCVLTGLKLKLQILDDTTDDQRSLARLVRLVGNEFCPGNVVPVARCVSQIAGFSSVTLLAGIAREYVRFTEFCALTAGTDRYTLLARWNLARPPCDVARDLGVYFPEWNETFIRKTIAVHARRHSRDDLDTKRCAAGQPASSADELYLLYKQQSARCWYTGLPMCDKRGSPMALNLSADRIDNSKPHYASNIHMTTHWFNNARGSDSPESVLQTLALIAAYSPTFGAVLQRIPHPNPK